MHRFANPARFLRIARVATPVCALLGLALLGLGLCWGLFYAPPDYLQGESVRIIYVHVPAASLAMGGYVGVAVSAAVAFIWRHPLADVAARAVAPVGATFAAICLISGSLWGRPTWGTYWVWDARLTSMLVLLFLFLGYMALGNAFDDRERGSRAAGILAIVGSVNIPIIKYSVEWWNTLHQGESIRIVGQSSIDPSMLQPLLVSWAGFSFLFAAIVLMRMRAQLADQLVAARAARLAGAHG
jgi:heme exporter protein C